MEYSNHLNITKMEANQAQKEVIFNQALAVIDALLNTGVQDRDLAIPPISPAEGDLYIPASIATGDWVGHEGKIAHYTNGAWQFITPREGLPIWINDENILVIYDGSAWNTPSFQNMPMLGINTSADAINKLAVATAAALFTHNGDDMQAKYNKASASDTVSHLFQTNFSGRAELGLIGNDDLTLKVSPDGSNWYNAVVIDNDNGEVSFPQAVIAESGIKPSSSSDAIDYFEEGLVSLTPYGTTTSGAPTGTFQASYQRLGNWVNAMCRLAFTSKGGMVGNLEASGLPFAVANTALNRAINPIAGSGFVGLAQTPPMVQPKINNAALALGTMAGSGGFTTNLTAAKISDSSALQFEVKYTV